MPTKWIATAGVLASTLVAAITAPAAARGDGVWIDGKAYTLLTGAPPAGAGHGVPLYVIAPVVASHPLHALADARTHGFGAHDHVLGAAARAAGFAGVCDLTLVVPGPKARPGRNVLARATVTPAGPKPLLYAVRLGGRLARLTATSTIGRASKLGLARLVDTGTLIACHVHPR